MNTDKHTVTIPIEDYNELINSNGEPIKQLDEAKRAFNELQNRIRQRVDAMTLGRVNIIGLDFNVESQTVQCRVGYMGDMNIEFVTPKQK